jgi:hypothetical protein
MSQQMTPRDKKLYEEWLETCKRIRLQTDQQIKHETEKQKRIRVARLLKPENFQEFIEYYFGDPESPFAPLAWFHKLAIEDLFVKEIRNHIWEWHRESAKSVFADIFVPIHMLVSGKLDGMILASENEDKAKNLIKDVQAQLISNKKLVHDFGDFGITGTWLQGFFQTKDGIGFWAFGLGQNPAGVRNGFKRPNLGIVDDADNKDKAKNQKLTKERVDWIRGEFMGCLATKNRTFLYVNNRVHKAGLTAHMVGDLEEGDEKDPAFNHIKAYLTEDPETHEKLLPEEGGVPAWKENYTVQDCINKIKDMGYRNAMRQLYHTHIEDGNVFTDENMPWIDVLPLHLYDGLVAYCDPAFGESGKGCFRAVVLLGKIGLNYDIIWVWIRQNGNFAAAHYKLYQMVKQNSKAFYGEGKVADVKSQLHRVSAGNVAGFRQQVNCEHWVESNELQKVLLKKIYKEENELRDEAWYPKFDMDKKADKIGRIESLETIADNGHLRFNAALKLDKDMKELRDQFKAFPDGYVDGPDAVEGAKAKLDKKVKKKNNPSRTGQYKKDNSRLG